MAILHHNGARARRASWLHVQTLRFERETALRADVLRHRNGRFAVRSEKVRTAAAGSGLWKVLLTEGSEESTFDATPEHLEVLCRRLLGRHHEVFASLILKVSIDRVRERILLWRRPAIGAGLLVEHLTDVHEVGWAMLDGHASRTAVERSLNQRLFEPGRQPIIMYSSFLPWSWYCTIAQRRAWRLVVPRWRKR